MLRFSLGCFALTAIVFVLQLFPLIGIFLMILAAPFWSIVLINLGFAGMFVEAWTDVESRWLAVFPVAWFGGYLMVTAVSHWQTHQYNEEIAASNQEKRVVFDPSTHDIIVEPDARDSFYGSSLTAANLIDSFSLSRAYQVTDSPDKKVQEYALRKVDCPGRMGSGVSGNGVWNRLHDGGYGTSRKRSTAQGLCLFISFTRPDRPTVRIRPLKRTEEHGLATRVSQDIEIRAPNGQTTLLRSGWAVPLAWFPKPIMGCWLNSGAPSWNCDIAFMRRSLYSPTEDRIPFGPDDVVGQALGLSKMSVRERYAELQWK